VHKIGLRKQLIAIASRRRGCPRPDTSSSTISQILRLPRMVEKARHDLGKHYRVQRPGSFAERSQRRRGRPRGLMV
jgi:hypothetical protein